MRIYPDTLPLMSWPDFSLSPVSQSIQTDMEVGDPKVRRQTFARRDMCDIGLRMTDAQFAGFRAWFGDEKWSLTGESDKFTGWVESRVTIAESGVLGPDGQVVYGITETAVTNTHIAQVSLAGLVAANATVVCRMTLRAAGRDFVRLAMVNMAGTGCVAVVNLATGAIVSTSNLISVAIVSRGNGWYRVEFIAPMESGVTSPIFRATISTDGTTTNYAGDDTKGVLATEQQVKVYTGADMYLPTDADGNVQGASGGSAWFGMAMPVGGGMAVKQCRFDGTFSAKPLQGLNWQVGGKLRVRHA